MIQTARNGPETNDLVIKDMFGVGCFHEDPMAFPPGVTFKNWTWAAPVNVEIQATGIPRKRAESVCQALHLEASAGRSHATSSGSFDGSISC